MPYDPFGRATGDAAVLVANRGEIAVRVIGAAAELGLRTVTVFSDDDAGALHVRRADLAHPLGGAGPAAYLDGARLVEIAVRSGCRFVHPGYGFLAEEPDFAATCEAAGLVFVGPTPEQLRILGDKTRARALAARCGVPTLLGTTGPASLADVQALLDALPAGRGVMVKAVHGGGGRGARPVVDPADLEATFARCASEARAAFGRDALFAEELLPGARHVEVQVLGDGTGAVTHLWERDCSLQRARQKLVEVAPAPHLSPDVRRTLLGFAVDMARALRLRGAATFEFLVGTGTDERRVAFLEANPRLQVEHPVTEAITGHDLVKAQLGLAAGHELADLELTQEKVPEPRGVALEARLNAETLRRDGTIVPSAGRITALELPSGPGVRVDTALHLGAEVSARFDSLLAKVVIHVPHGDLEAALRRADRALAELHVEGVATNLALLRALVRHPQVARGAIHTRFVDEHRDALLPATDPSGTRDDDAQDGRIAVRASLHGTVVTVGARPGDHVRLGQELLVVEAMKMEHAVTAPADGIVERVMACEGQAVSDGDVLAWIAARPAEGDASAPPAAVDLDRIRPDLAEVIERHQLLRDARRPSAVAKRRAAGRRTARENVDDLCDPGSFVEYGGLAIAAQRRRRDLDDLIRNTPADGLVAGIGRVNGELFGPVASRAVVLAYDYTVLAGTQGLQNHRKKDRLFEIAERRRLPVVLLSEGGGGRPGDTDAPGGAGLDTMAFRYFARLSGLVPLVGVNAGRCFAGNAALLGCCDVVIATAGSSIGMGGPAMIEGGGLGTVDPDAVGPMAVQTANGVVDVAVEDEAAAVRVAKRYLAYFQGRTATWTCADQRRLRTVVPENRLRAYDVRTVVETLADADSVLELRPTFGSGMVTALARIEGMAVGVVANNPAHGAGAIASDEADKASRLCQLCDAFGLPIVFLCDTPGIMVGPDAERRALVRHAARMFVVGASLTVPCCTVVLRKGYGLGAMAMAAGSFKATTFTVAWPTGEFGGMGLEGAVKLGFRKELERIADPAGRQAAYEGMVARMYEHGKALSTASVFEIDDVIDPAETRERIVASLPSDAADWRRRGRRRPCIDPW
jgi:acetyl/propionyl-CoA carboxylase alpha subunit